MEKNTSELKSLSTKQWENYWDILSRGASCGHNKVSLILSLCLIFHSFQRWKLLAITWTIFGGKGRKYTKETIIKKCCEKHVLKNISLGPQSSKPSWNCKECIYWQISFFVKYFRWEGITAKEIKGHLDTI